MIDPLDRLDLTPNERQIWLCAFAQHASADLADLGPAEWIRRSERFAQAADRAVTRFRELMPYHRPRER